MGLAESIWNEYKKLTGKIKPNDSYRGTKPTTGNSKTAKENEDAANEGYAQAPEDEE